MAQFREFVENANLDYNIVSLYSKSPAVSVKEISTQTGKSIGEIYRTLENFGVNPNRQIKNHENVRILSDSGLNLNSVAKLTGYTPRNIRYILKKEEK